MMLLMGQRFRSKKIATSTVRKGMGLLEIWQRRKERKAAAKAEKERRLAEFASFLQETTPLTPHAKKHVEAALYRFTWKRAVALETVAETARLPDEVEKYQRFQEFAANAYYKVAPETLYGKPKLQLSPKAHGKLIQQEIARLVPSNHKPQRVNGELACIYLGNDVDTQMPYIGQTTGDPEGRWKQHRDQGTGPFKSGAEYATWEVLERNVSPLQLDEKEAYFIGFYNAYDNGHNDTRGNDMSAYEKGRRDSEH